MKHFLELLFGVLATVAALAASLEVDENVNLVYQERFDGDLDVCRKQEVCADVFNFTRDHGNGTGRLESRFIQNCRCPPGSLKCGESGMQLMFKETKKQSMVICEAAWDVPVCQGDEIAKEQHNIGNYIYYKINCVCPNNENPGDFRNKMTTVKQWKEFTLEEQEIAQARENRRSRFFKCRKTNEEQARSYRFL